MFNVRPGKRGGGDPNNVSQVGQCSARPLNKCHQAHPDFFKRISLLRVRRRTYHQTFPVVFLKKSHSLLGTLVLESYSLNLEDSLLALVLRGTSTLTTRYLFYYEVYLWFLPCISKAKV